MTRQPTQNLTDSEHEDARVSDLMSPALGVFRPEMTVAETVEELRELTRSAMITYCYVTEEDGRLVGVVVMRDMLLATPETTRRAATLIDRYPDRFLFGSDVVAPRDTAQYYAVFEMYRPLWALLTPEASEKVRKGNYERLFDAARQRVRAWERAQGW